MRKATHVSQESIGERMGLTQGPVGAVEQAPHNGRVVNYVKIQSYAAALGYELTIGLKLDEQDNQP